MSGYSNEAEDAERELKKLVYDYFNDDLLLVCDRVWEAWHVGTMTEDDFSRIDEDDYVLPELVRRLSAFVEAQKQKWVEQMDASFPTKHQLWVTAASIVNADSEDHEDDEIIEPVFKLLEAIFAAWRAALRGERK